MLPRIAAAATTVQLWACAFVAIRLVVPVLGPSGLSCARLVVASLGLAVAAPLLRLRRPHRRDLPRLGACGLTGMAAYQLLLNAGERSVPAGTASLLVNTAPLFVLPLAALLLGERPTRRALAGIAIGFAGAGLIALGHSGGDAAGGGLVPTADALLVLGAAAAQATFFVLQKPLLARYRAVDVVTYATWFGTLACLPWAAAALSRLPRLDGGELAALLFLGLGASAVGFVCWAFAGAEISVGAATATLYAVAPVAVLVGWLALGERPTPVVLIGGALALAGIALARSGPHPGASADLGPPVSADLGPPGPPLTMIIAGAPEPRLGTGESGRRR